MTACPLPGPPGIGADPGRLLFTAFDAGTPQLLYGWHHECWLDPFYAARGWRAVGREADEQIRFTKRLAPGRA